MGESEAGLPTGFDFLIPFPLCFCHDISATAFDLSHLLFIPTWRLGRMKPPAPARRVLDIPPFTQHPTFRPAPWTESERRLLRLHPTVA